MARHNEGYAAYLLGDIPRSLAGMARAEELESDVFTGPARLDRAQVLLEAGLVKEAVEALHGGPRRPRGRGPRPDAGRVRARPGARPPTARAPRPRGVGGGVGAGDLLPHRGDRLGGQGDARRAARRPRPAAAHPSRSGAGRSERADPAPTSAGDRRRRRHRGARGGGDRRRARPTRRPSWATPSSPTARGSSQRRRCSSPMTRRGQHAPAQPRAGLHRLALRRARRGGRHRDDARRHRRPGARPDASSCGPRAASPPARRAARASTCAPPVPCTAPGSPSSTSTSPCRGAAPPCSRRWSGGAARPTGCPRSAGPTTSSSPSLTEQLRAVRGHLRGEDDPAQVRELHDHASRLERQIRDRDWALSRSGGAARAVPVRVREAREHLGRVDRDLVWFFRHRGRLGAVGVIGGRASMRDLMPVDRAAELAQRIRVDLRAAATHHLGPLAVAVWSSLRSSATELDDALMRPWRTDRGLVVVTCPEVSALPWALLPSMAGRPFTVALSLTSFARRACRHATTSSRACRASTSASARGSPARRARARAIVATWGERARLAEPSRRDGLVGALARPGVVHVAAHGTHQVESPLFSSLVLHDGPVFAHELQPTGVRRRPRRALGLRRRARPRPGRGTSRSASRCRCSRSVRGRSSPPCRPCPTTSPRRR